MQSILLSVHILVAISLIALVLLQHGRGADVGAAFGAGASGSVFGSRGSASFLTRTTAVLAAVFFLNSMFLGYLSTQAVERTSVVDRVQTSEPAQPVPAVEEEGIDVPSVPVEGGAPSDVPLLPPE